VAFDWLSTARWASASGASMVRLSQRRVLVIRTVRRKRFLPLNYRILRIPWACLLIVSGGRNEFLLHTIHERRHPRTPRESELGLAGFSDDRDRLTLTMRVAVTPKLGIRAASACPGYLSLGPSRFPASGRRGPRLMSRNDSRGFRSRLSRSTPRRIVATQAALKHLRPRANPQ